MSEKSNNNSKLEENVLTKDQIDKDFIEPFQKDYQEIPEFVPTRHELIQVLRYWTRIYIDIVFVEFVYSAYGTAKWRLCFSQRQMGRIVELLGEEARKVIKDAIAEYGREHDERTWNIFMNGTKEEQNALQEEIMTAENERAKLDGNLN